MYHGDIRLGETIDLKCCTVGTTGAPTTLAGSPVIAAYPGNSTTQLTAGMTLSVDFDSITGLHNIRVVATSGNGYATATNYTLVITTGTVGGTSVVGYCVGSFSIENRSALMPTTAARTLDVSSGGEAGVDWANVGSPTTTLTLSGTTVKTATDVETDTQDLQSRLPAALVSGHMESSVGAMANDVVTASAIAADAIGASELAASAVSAIQSGLSTLDAAGVRSAVGLAAANLDTQLGAIDDYLDTEVAAIKAKTDTLPATPANEATLTTIAGYLDTEVAAIKAKNDLLPASPAATGDAMTLTSGERTSIADALLKRDWTAVTGEAARSMLNALRFLRNKWSMSGTTLTVTTEDDSTAAWTSTVTVDATADPGDRQRPGLGAQVPAGFRSVFLLFGLSASAAVVPPPPPPPPVASPADATPVRLTPAQIARLRGHVPPPRRQLADEEAELEAVSVDALRPRERPAGPTRPALLKTARVADPGPDWAPTLVLAQADLHRRQALAQAAEDEEALLLMLVLLEVL